MVDDVSHSVYVREKGKVLESTYSGTQHKPGEIYFVSRSGCVKTRLTIAIGYTMDSKTPTPEELETSRDARALQQRIWHQEAHIAYLRKAKRFRVDGALDISLIEAAISQADDELRELIAAAGGRVVPRKKSKVDSSQTCTVFIDECGSHSLTAKEDFGAFCLAAVIVRDEDRDVFDAKWRRWKLQNLGSENAGIHEPIVRKKTGKRFYLGGDTKKQDQLIQSLCEIIAELEFAAIVCVIHRQKYVERHGDAAMDASLPHHGYLMALNFMAERIALALQTQFGGAKTHLILESRGPKEDAAMQYEFARLFLDGTSYLDPSYFRRQFFPGLEFRSKDNHIAGLEIADLLARPCAEKVLDPKSNPERWPQFRAKLCQGEGETKHSILGFKVIPWDECFEGLWKS